MPNTSLTTSLMLPCVESLSSHALKMGMTTAPADAGTIFEESGGAAFTEGSLDG